MTQTFVFQRQGAIRLVGWLAVAAMLAVALMGPAAARTFAGGAGAIWTTSVTCQTPAAQDQNQYATGDHVHIRGEGFDPNSTHAWTITGQPGGASSDPGQVVKSGTVTADATGYFCVDAYTIEVGDDGEYTVDVVGASKNDNYRVNGTVPESAPPSQDVSAPPSQEVSAPPSQEVSAPPSQEVSAPPSQEVSAPPSQEVSAPPSGDGGVLGETATPKVTLPPTDALGGTSGPSSDSWRMLLIAMAGLLATILVVTPSRSARRR